MTALLEGALRHAVSVGGLLFGAILVAVWVVRRPASALARRALVAWLALSVIVSTYPLPSVLTRVLASGFTEVVAVDIPTGPIAIVVLGSGAIEYTGRDGSQLRHLDSAGALRVLEAYRIFRMRPDAWLISSGGATRLDRPSPTTGAVMRDALIALGVPAAQILLENESQSTRDEAVLVAHMLEERDVPRAIVVTQGFHMRRALATFRAAGIDAIPAITVDPVVQRPSDWWWPSPPALAFTGVIAREFLATGWYWSRGWI